VIRDVIPVILYWWCDKLWNSVCVSCLVTIVSRVRILLNCSSILMCSLFLHIMLWCHFNLTYSFLAICRRLLLMRNDWLNVNCCEIIIVHRRTSGRFTHGTLLSSVMRVIRWLISWKLQVWFSWSLAELLRQTSLLTLERSVSKFKVKTDVQKIAQLWLEIFTKFGNPTNVGLPEVIFSMKDVGLVEVYALWVLYV